MASYVHCGLSRGWLPACEQLLEQARNRSLQRALKCSLEAGTDCINKRPWNSRSRPGLVASYFLAQIARAIMPFGFSLVEKQYTPTSSISSRSPRLQVPLMGYSFSSHRAMHRA